MPTTDEAKAKLDETIDRALAGRDAPPLARVELAGHLHGAAERLAREEGREDVTAEDVARATEEAGGPDALGAAFAGAPARPARMWRRAAAYAVDVAVVHGAILLAWTLSWTVAAPIAARRGGDLGWLRPDPFQFLDLDDVRWDGVPGVSIARGLMLGAVLVGVPFLYFVLGDVRTGRTVGKRALGLRAVDVDGERVGVGAALARSVLKASLLLAPLLLVDALLGRGRRATDRAARVTVLDEGAAGTSP